MLDFSFGLCRSYSTGSLRFRSSRIRVLSNPTLEIFLQLQRGYLVSFMAIVTGLEPAIPVDMTIGHAMILMMSLFNFMYW